MKVTKWLKPSNSGHDLVTARVCRPQRVWEHLCQGSSRAVFSVLVGSNMNDPREARLLARCAPQPCIRLSRHRLETMKQSFASTARLRGGGPILGTASIPWLCSGLHHLGS